MSQATPKVAVIKVWVPVLVAIITILGSVVTSIISSRASVAGQVQDTVSTALDARFPNLRLSDIQSGRVEGNQSMTGWTLSTVPRLPPGNQERAARVFDTHITFPRPFTDIPQIVVGLTSLDLNHEHNTRITMNVSDISRDGFTLDFQTWSDTEIYWVSADWLAFQTQGGVVLPLHASGINSTRASTLGSCKDIDPSSPLANCTLAGALERSRSHEL